jgi:DNA-binding GntR family transcriptional regulator
LCSPLRALEIREIYPIIASLEVLALRSAGLPDNNQLKALSHLNDLYARGRRDAREVVLLDTKFHDLLLSHCPKRRLIRLIHQHRLLLKRHELVFMEQDSFFVESRRQHDRIIAALRRSQLRRACKLLEENWLAGMKLLLLRTEWRD